MGKLFDSTTPHEVLTEALNSEKFKLVCSVHRWAYGSKQPPCFSCKQCMMVNFVGLLCNTPPSQREERVDQLEAMVHHMVEAAKRGDLSWQKYFHPQVEIEKDGLKDN